MDEKELKVLMDGIAKENGTAIQKAVETQIKLALKDVVSVEILTTKLEAVGLKDDAIKKITDAVEKQGIEIGKLLAGKAGEPKFKDLDDFVHKNKDEILKAENGRIKLKVDKTLVQTSAVSGNTMGYRVAGVGQLPTRGLTLMETLRRIGSVISLSEAEVMESAGVIRYLDQNVITRGAAFVLEGAQKPESAITWIERSLPMEYIADSIPVTRQAWRRLGFIRGEIDKLLRMNLAMKIDDQLLTGSGVAPNLKGLLVSAPNLVDANLITQTGTVPFANLFDFIAALKVYVTNGNLGTGKQSKYLPQVALMPPGLALQAKRTKATDGHYATPHFVSPDGKNVDGIEIIEVPGMVANTMLLGDFRYVSVYEEEGYTVEMGLIDKQFVENKWTIRAEQALAQLIRVVDEDAFVEVTDVAASIAAITTAP